MGRIHVLGLLFIFTGVLVAPDLCAQKARSPLRDTLDNKLDASNFVVNLHGFVPYPIIISEPALGNFGGALALVFMSPKRTAKKTEQFRFPDITAVIGMYTLNNSWATGAFRQGSFPSIGMRYQIAALYADLNLHFYRDIAGTGEQDYLITLKPVVAMLDVSENLYKYKIFAGLNYFFTYTKVSGNFESLPDSLFSRLDFEKNIGMAGLYAELDTRNSIFTPDRGIRLKATYSIGRQWTGSQINMDKLDIYTNIFLQPFHWWVTAFRAAAKGVSPDAPFYYYPFIEMRGIPIMRYQGQKTLLFETEQRFDLTFRWSILGFAGSGRTYNTKEYLSDKSWHWAGGTGFRYLLARVFRLRVGVDVAVSKGQFAYYIIFGHNWNR